MEVSIWKKRKAGFYCKEGDQKFDPQSRGRPHCCDHHTCKFPTTVPSPQSTLSIPVCQRVHVQTAGLGPG